MRRPRHRRSASLALIGTLVVLAPGGWSAADADESAPPGVATSHGDTGQPSDQDGAPQDYYGRRAAAALKREQELASPAPHALAAAYPEHTVVVCEAGCGSERKAEIVYMQRARRTQTEGAMVPTSTGLAVTEAARAEATTPSSETTIECVGGCYDTPRHYPAARVSARMPAPAANPAPRPKRDPFDPRR